MARETASLWVRYLGSRSYVRAETLLIPTTLMPIRIAKLLARGDVAEIWWQANADEFSARVAHKQYDVHRS